MRTLFKECEDVITIKDYDDRELITVNLRLVNKFSHWDIEERNVNLNSLSFSCSKCIK